MTPAEGFSLWENPFALLGLTAAATQRETQDRARELGTSDAQAAARAVIAPRPRLEAEIRFLPGAPDEQVRAVLDTLRKGGMPDLWGLSLPARANVLAHRAAEGLADATQLQLLVSLHGEMDAGTVAATIGDDRTAAGMPQPNGELLERSLEKLADDHARAMVIGVVGAETQKASAQITALLTRNAAQQQNDRLSFLRRVCAAWDRETASMATQAREHAQDLAGTLSKTPKVGEAESLAATIEYWAQLTAPQRKLDALVSLGHRLINRIQIRAAASLMRAR